MADFYNFFCLFLVAEPLGKLEEGAVVYSHTNVPEQPSQLGARSAGSMALCVAVTERAGPCAACYG